MKEIKLHPYHHNKVALVDDDWYEELSKYKWRYEGKYAKRYVWAHNKRSTINMHQVIINVKENEEVDHIDLNKLNNTTANLRSVPHYINMQNVNKKPNTRSKSKYKGVTFFINGLGIRWKAKGSINKVRYVFGSYSSEIAAAYAYNKNMAQLCEYTLLNDLEYSIDYLENLLVETKIKRQAIKRSGVVGILWAKNKYKAGGCWVVSTPLANKKSKCYKNLEDAKQAMGKYKKNIDES